MALGLRVGLVVVAACAMADAAGPRPITTADLYLMRTVGDVMASPDGRRIAYTVLSHAGPGRPRSQIWVADVANGRLVQVNRDKDTGMSPTWSPDSRRIAFVGELSSQRGLFVVRADGSAVRRVATVHETNHPLPSTGRELSWSPDSRRIAFLSSTPGPEALTTDPVVITRYLYKPPASSVQAPFNDNRRLHIFLADTQGGEVRQLTRDDTYEHSVTWSPRGDDILFVSNRERDADRVFNNDIFIVNARSGAVRRLTQTPAAEYEPIWSPDGSKVAFLATRRSLTSSETTMEDTHVSVMASDGSARRELTPAIDNRHGAPQWSRDGTRLLFSVQQRGSSCLYAQTLDGAAAQPITPCLGTVGAWSALPDGVAFAWTTTREPAELYLVKRAARASGAAAPVRLTRLNDTWLPTRAVARSLPMVLKSFDGLAIEAFLLEPVGLDPSRKYPLVVMIHGGPHSQQGPAFNAKAQIYAGAGFAALMVNYRGSTGYGQQFADAILGDQDGGEAQDVLAGVSAAIAKYPWIDRNALFVEGTSYGGQLTNWLVTQTDRFKAAASLAGIANLVSFNYMAYYHDYLAVEFGGYPHERDLMDRLWERSPIRSVRDVHTPVLLLHGENDNDVPIAEAEQFYIALKDAGVETMMVRYPREGHGLRETQHVADAIERTIGWYKRHYDKAAP